VRRTVLVLAQPLNGLLSRPPAGAQVAGTTWSRGQSSSSFSCILFPATSGDSLSIFDIAAVTCSFGSIFRLDEYSSTLHLNFVAHGVC
jgi:hypothetical protein